MKSFRNYVINKLLEAAMYSDEDIINFMPGDVEAKIAQIEDDNLFRMVVDQVAKEVNQAYSAFVARQGPSPDVDAIWRKYADVKSPADLQRVSVAQPTPAPAQPAGRAARAIGIQRPVGSMSMQDIENSIKSYVAGTRMESGLVKNLDLETRREIEHMRRFGEIVPVEGAGKARMEGSGVHFFNTPKGLAFMVVRPGVAPMGRKFGTY